MNHRTTSACNCISVPIINVSTATLFMKAVIIKSQVGEIWTTNAYLKKPFLCSSGSKYRKSNGAGVYELSWAVCSWNSILNGFWGVWLPVEAPSVTHGFLSIFWAGRGVKADPVSSETNHLIFGPIVKAGEKGSFTFILIKNVYSQNRRLELLISPPSLLPQTTPPGNLGPSSCWQKCQDI